MQVQPGTFCPIIKDECLQNKCKFWVQLRGTHPQTGAPVDEWDCAVWWLPMLLTEVSQQARQTAAAVESFRNEVVQLPTPRLVVEEQVHEVKELLDKSVNHT